MITTKQIRTSNPQGCMTMVSGNNDIIFDNGIIFTSENSKEKQKLWNKLIRIGFNRYYNFSSDENDGLVQAALNGENPFAFTILQG